MHDHGSDIPEHARGPVLTRAGVARGMVELLPVSISVVIFGIAFGIAARADGLDPRIAVLMSAMVFAGAAQFAVLDLWQTPVPWVPLMLATFAVNARHLLLGASLYSWCSRLPPLKRYGAMVLLSDPNWAMTMLAIGRGEKDAGHILGGGLTLWTAWVVGTGLGVAASGLSLHDVERYGLDLIFVAFFTCTLVGLRRGRLDDLPWLVAGGVALLAMWLLPANWHVLAGGLAGGLTGLLQGEKRA
ncbi:MAG TPA: AzlC family ABC transporter permease [Xanthobacteraceae bacterium]|nr:AzlC family ABC transporter permease [Xanthobacteraceae bacterium]